MKKTIVVMSILFVIAAIAGCKSGPSSVYTPPPVSPAKYKTIFVDFVYDPIFLITQDEKTGVIEDLQSRLHAMGFAISTSRERADMLLTVTVDELELVRRNDRLVARTTFGLAKDAASMAYTASFVDNGTLDEIVSKKGRMKTSKYFPSKEKLKKKFLGEMEDEIIKFVSEYKGF
jgi:hypothetical protein